MWGEGANIFDTFKINIRHIVRINACQKTFPSLHSDQYLINQTCAYQHLCIQRSDKVLKILISTSFQSPFVEGVLFVLYNTLDKNITLDFGDLIKVPIHPN